MVPAIAFCEKMFCGQRSWHDIKSRPAGEIRHAEIQIGKRYRDAGLRDGNPMERFSLATVLLSPSLLMRLLLPSALIFLILDSVPVWAWGQNGHRIVAEIAQHRLSDNAAQAISELLGGRRLTDISTDPDDLRSDPRWSCAATFHYVTVPEGIQYPDADIDGWENGDAVTWHLVLEQTVAQPASQPSGARCGAGFPGPISWAISTNHFTLARAATGAATQFKSTGSDSRGTCIRFGIKPLSNLRISVTPNTLRRSSAIDSWFWGWNRPRLPSGSQRPRPTSMTSTNATSEMVCPCFCGSCADGLSVFGGCEMTGGCRLQVSNRVKLGYRYKFRTKPIVERQLKRGGSRLAHLLNQLFEAHQLPDSYKSLGEKIEQIEGWDEALRGVFRCRPGR